MKFSNKEQTKLLDFIISLETLNKKFILERERDLSSSIEETILFNFYKDYYSDTLQYQKEISFVSGEINSPTLQFLYRSFYASSKNSITDYKQFLKELNKLDPDELKFLIIKVLDILSHANENYTYLSAGFYSDEDIFEKLMDTPYSNEQKFNIIYTYKHPEKYIASVNLVFENVYPIFSKHYDKAEKFLKNKISEIKSMPKSEILPTTNNFFGNEKLSTLLSNHYNKHYDSNPLNLDFIDSNYNLEISLLIFGYFRIAVVGLDKHFWSKDSNSENKIIYAIGLLNFGLSEMNKENDLVRKKILKALSDDTRFDILRMIAFGFDTNKKLSEFFQISPPAITYQTNILKEASLVFVTDKGTFGVNFKHLDNSFEKIKNLLNIHGEV